MALKYISEYNDFYDNLWRIEIDSPTWSSDPINLTPSGAPLVKEYSGNNDDNPFLKHVISSSVTIGVVSTGLDIDELIYINDASYKCRVYMNNTLDFQGFVISDGVQDRDSGVDFDVTIRAIDGLELLDNVTFKWADNYPAIIVNGQTSALRSPINALRVALFGEPNLDNRLPIRWNTSLKNLQYPNDDMLAGRSQINANGDLIQSQERSALWWLDNISKSSLSWAIQQDGYWNFINIIDLINSGGTFTGNQITTNTSNIEIATPVSIDMNIDGNDKVNDNWFWFGKKPLSGVKVTYQDTTIENNVFPNASFDKTFLGAVTDWYSENGSAFLSSEQPLTIDGTGKSLSIDNRFVGADDYITFGEIPLDSSILFKTATLGFKWLPISGFPTYATDDTIDFRKSVFSISVRYNIGGVDYYLNEFGYWGDQNQPANAVITRTVWDSSQGGRYQIDFNPDRPFYAGDQVYIQFIRNGVLEFYSIPFTETVDVESGLNYITTKIFNSAVPAAPKNVMYITGVTDSIQNVARTEKVDDWYKRIQISVDNLKLNDVADIQFQSKGNSSEIKMPKGLGKLYFNIYSRSGSYMWIDDSYFKVSDNHDVYEIDISSSKNSKEDYTLGISSSFSGHMVSNYMNSYKTSDLSMLWTGNKTLTQIYGEAVMNTRNTPNRIFSGSIDKKVGWGIIDIKGKKYIPLSIKIDCSSLISDVVAVELSYNELMYTVKHKSSGDS